ncbi:MAG: hypothetical protein ABI367_03900 [Mucilaginibacter sp.]
MKKLLAILLSVTCFGAYAQDSLGYYNQSREHIKLTGMKVLGSWAAGNIAIGGISSFNTTGSTKYFHQMNAFWNLVNLGAATSGYLSSQKNKNKTLTADEVLMEQRKIEKIFLVNGALDVAYIGGGAYLNNRGINNNDDKLKGYGSSIILQGAFLLLFDATMYTSEKRNGKKLVQFLQTHPVNFDGHKIGMVFKL